MMMYVKLGRTSEELESYPYYEYEMLIDNYIEYIKKITKASSNEILDLSN